MTAGPAETGTVEGVLAGRAREIGRALSAVEREGGAPELLRSLFPRTGRARILGITGPPGAGKSTLVQRLAQSYRRRGHRVAIVAVDPSSPFTGGAILGDRMQQDVQTAELDYRNAETQVLQQEAILKSVLTKTGNQDPEVQAARIIPTDSLTIPEKEDIQPIQDLLAAAIANRPDLSQAGLQVENSEIGLKGSRNAVRPQMDLVGVAQNNGLAGAVNPLSPTPDTALIGGYGTALDQILTRKFPTYGIGLQLTLPIRNRIAEADLARDEIQLKQSQIRVRQLQNQARLEVEDALIAMRRARSSHEAAVQARVLQEESLAAEQAKFEVGASTSFFVIQYESLLAQAKSTEVAAKSAYVKARAALQRATGTILSEHQISMSSALQNHP